MKFYDYVTNYDQIKKEIGNQWTVEECYDRLMKENDRRAVTEGRHSITHDQFVLEKEWIAAKRPYYIIWPKVVPYLVRLKLDTLKVNYISFPKTPLAFRFSEDIKFWEFESNGEKFHIKSILAFNVEKIKRYLVYIDIGEVVPNSDFRMMTYRCLFMEKDLSIEESLDRLPEDESINIGVQVPNDLILSALKVTLTSYLLAHDQDENSLLEPDVLNKDRRKFDETGDMKYAEKAKRRGKFGWHVGRSIKVSPHWRSASPLALYWTGKGRTIPKLRYRKGTVVHRKKIQDIPTGIQN